jgi:predicted glycoside hydrolase/deacetylase ChbG (UPF0249 family)
MPASLAERLGLAADARTAIVHCDDIGMCHAANEGAFEALARGPATCGSVMVPCPWFREAAARAVADPSLDLGVHLTLNSEWPHYRWGPVAGPREVPSLVDDQGCLYRTTRETLERGRPEEVALELRAQLERALSAGIDVTHLDSHMGTCMMPPFLQSYIELGCEYRLPVFVVRPDDATLARIGARFGADLVERALATLEAGGLPILDGFCDDSLGFAPGTGSVHNARRLARLRSGVSYLICHPARGGEELSAISEDAHARDFERRFYGGEEGRRALAAEGIATLGMRSLRDLVRASG